MSERKNQGGYGFAIGTLLCCGAFVGGLMTRERHDPAIFERTLAVPSGLVASNSKDAPDGNYFEQLTDLLNREYVDPVDNPMKLATGAVRGMVLSLNDPDSFFYSEKEFPILMKAMNGSYEGIGADMDFKFIKTSPQASNSDADEDPVESGFPQLTIASVVPGGPADKAGLKPGDWIDTVDGYWVANNGFVSKAREIQEKVQKKQLPQSALDDLRKELRVKMDKNISPLRAWNKLMSGEGPSKIKVYRGKELLTLDVVKAPSQRPLATSAIRPSFTPGSAQAFAQAVRGKSELTFDLRGAAFGDFSIARSYVAQLAPKGSFGVLTRTEKPEIALTTKEGPAKAPKMTVLVDAQTRGVPEAFALMLKQAGATIQGKSAGAPIATEITALPDGSGYTLAIGTWKAKGGAR